MPRVRPDAAHPKRKSKRAVVQRRAVNPATAELDYSDEERIFLGAVQEYKQYFGRPFPSWSEVLEVVRALGYRRVAQPIPIRSLPKYRPKVTAG